MKKTFYYLLSTFLLFISSMQGLNASASSADPVEERIINAMSALHASVQSEAFKHTTRLYATEPGELETILSLLGELKDIKSSIQPLVVGHVACIDNVPDMTDVVESWCQVNHIEDAALQELAITCMENAKSLRGINNIGNAWDTLGKIENRAIQLEALKKMLATRSTKKMNKIAERAASKDNELNEILEIQNG